MTQETFNTLLAAYGAMVATMSIIFVALNWRQKQPRLKVCIRCTLRKSTVTEDFRWLKTIVSGKTMRETGNHEKETIYITVANPSLRESTIQELGVILPNGSKAKAPRRVRGIGARDFVNRYPHALLPGQNTKDTLRVDDVRKKLTEAGYSDAVAVQGYCEDALGRIFKGNKVRINVSVNTN